MRSTICAGATPTSIASTAARRSAPKWPWAPWASMTPSVYSTTVSPPPKDAVWSWTAGFSNTPMSAPGRPAVSTLEVAADVGLDGAGAVADRELDARDVGQRGGQQPPP